MPQKTWTHHRARVANAVLRGDEEAADEARRDLKAARAEDYIRKLVDEAPPLTTDQRASLAALLGSGGAQ
jgi:hypothetical protein